MEPLENFKREIRNNEGVFSHMYLDTAGNVTVGIGNMIPGVSEAQNLGFVNRKTGQPATKDEIKKDFEEVKKQIKGMKAEYYKKFTTLDLPSTKIDRLLDARIAEFKRQLGQAFPKFGSYPQTAQFAMMDMAFNLGTYGLVTKFPNFKKAVEAEDWLKAATESDRPECALRRNLKVQAWLQEAAEAVKAARAKQDKKDGK